MAVQKEIYRFQFRIVSLKAEEREFEGNFFKSPKLMVERTKALCGICIKQSTIYFYAFSKCSRVAIANICSIPHTSFFFPLYILTNITNLYRSGLDNNFLYLVIIKKIFIFYYLTLFYKISIHSIKIQLKRIQIFGSDRVLCYRSEA